MDLRQLRYFVAVAETRHFSTAAARLQIAPSPLTHAMRQFESQLGTAFFVRSPRSVELTAAGRALFDEAPGILASIGSSEDRLSQMAVGHRGVLTIAATGLAAYRILPRMGLLLAELLPDVALRFVPGLLTAAQEEALVGNRVDVGIIRPPSRHGSLGTRTLVRERMVAAVPDGPFARRESLTLTDLNRSGFVMYGVRDSVVDAIVTRACLRAGFLPHRTAESAAPQYCSRTSPVGAEWLCCRNPYARSPSTACTTFRWPTTSTRTWRSRGAPHTSRTPSGRYSRY